MSDNNKPSILFFHEISNEPVGGKAAGLAELVKLGFDVPDGFVIIDAQQGDYPDNLLDAYEKIGMGKVAVRSSALGEDAADHSFAGQYETILNVDGAEHLYAAIDQCIESLNNERSIAYQQDQGEAIETRMCVVVQQMVDAVSAGVLFTVDPVSGRYDRLIIDAVKGLGEALVDGSTTPDHYVLDETNKVVGSDLVGEMAILTDEQLADMAKTARNANDKMGKPLDMEWAVNSEGKVLWLQARPITTVGSDLRELDSHIPHDHVITRCNISEVIPGVSCPLTISVQLPSFSYMLNALLNGYSGRKPHEEPVYNNCAVASHGYLFVNLSAQVDIAKYTLLGTAENTALPICGRVIPELKEPEEKRNILRRAFAIRHFVSYLRSTKKEIADFAQAMQSFYMPFAKDSATMINEIEARFDWLNRANRVHGHSSCRSGVYESMIQIMISKGNKIPTTDEQALAAKAMAGAEGVESALLVDQLDALVDLIADTPKSQEKFADVAVEKAIKWLESPKNAAVNRAYKAFLKNHGHRGYRELELMTPAWIDDPVPLVESMQASVHARFAGLGSTKAHEQSDLSALPWLVRKLVPLVHDAIRGREQTKSLLVRTTHYIKQGYLHLADLMVKEKLLPEAELLYFFTHEELKKYIAEKQPDMLEKAIKRRISFSFQEQLHFEDIAVGPPSPVENFQIELENGQLQGRPVSKGVVEGYARVAMNVKEAAALKPGEILIAPITDVAWTPYFSLISGLATDVGSAVSHGAVIAREYGLPCIVNLQGATTAFETGDYVRLDAETGVISKLDKKETA